MAYTIAEAQRHNADLYREWARRAPWNSRTRAAWLELAEQAEEIASRAEEGGQEHD